MQVIELHYISVEYVITMINRNIKYHQCKDYITSIRKFAKKCKKSAYTQNPDFTYSHKINKL